MMPSCEKIVSKRKLKKIRDTIVVLAHGCYDVLSIAHMRHLEWAKEQGDILVVSVTSDAHIARRKGEGRPHFTHKHRAEMVAGLNCVDHVVICYANSALSIIEELRPNIYVKGGDTIANPSDWFNDERLLVEKYGGEVRFSPTHEEVHTTEVRHKILSEE